MPEFPEFIDGLPLHPLIVHFVVVLLPVTAAGAVLVAVWPAARRRFGWLVVAAAGVSTLLVPVATISGENLVERLGSDRAIERHQDLGDQMIYFALPLFVVMTALMIVHRTVERRATAADQPDGEGREGGEGGDGGDSTESEPTDKRRPAWTGQALVVTAVLTVGLAIGTGVHIYRVGDAGARAVWDYVEQMPPESGG